MKPLIIPAMLALVGTGSALHAQQPRMGVALNLVLPTGTSSSRDSIGFDNAGVPYRFNEGYDPGLGGQFTISFPVDPHLAIRLNLGGHVMDGSNTAPGYAKINLRHSMFSVGGDLQLFTQSAYRHRGTYFLAGLSADFERFERTFGSFDHSYWWNDDQIDTTRKSRMGGNFGIGHTFGYDAGLRFTMEATYHATLTGRDEVDTTIPGVMKNTNFVRLSFGVVF